MKRLALCSGLLTLAGTLLWLLLRWEILLPVTITTGTVFYHIAIRLLIGQVFDRFLPNGVSYRNPRFQPAPWEKTIYEKLRVKRWKNKMPTYTPIEFQSTAHSWKSIVRAMCKAELIHEVNVVVSFVPIFFSLWLGAFPVFAVTSVLAAGYDLLFVILQRYNRPRVLRLVLREGRSHRHSGNGE